MTEKQRPPMTDKQNQTRDIEDIQRSLRTLSREDTRIPSLNVDGLFGPETASSLSAFQRTSGLPATGKADNITWDALFEAYRQAVTRESAALPVPFFPSPDTVLVTGSIGDAVYAVQMMINRVGLEVQNLPAVKICGRYDEETAKAVEAFQQLFQLPVTGQTDKETWDALTISYAAR